MHKTALKAQGFLPPSESTGYSNRAHSVLPRMKQSLNPQENIKCIISSLHILKIALVYILLLIIPQFRKTEVPFKAVTTESALRAERELGALLPKKAGPGSFSLDCFGARTHFSG